MCGAVYSVQYGVLHLLQSSICQQLHLMVHIVHVNICHLMLFRKHGKRMAVLPFLAHEWATEVAMPTVDLQLLWSVSAVSHCASYVKHQSLLSGANAGRQGGTKADARGGTGGGHGSG